ncbi:MAG: peptidylprolyl isomerase [Methanobacteriaceae archaeon]|nr:peptidylprolyl isomerase [Methanobacteriaceae archaeon]
MAVKEGDFIRLEYTAKTKETGDVFDTTIEEVAEEAGILAENKNYGPIPIVVSGGHVLKGLDEALVGMKEGEEKTVELTPEDAFGKRDSKLVQLVPMREFKKQKLKPYVGMAITSEGHTGIIRRISGGRVTVDFNHELAGKNLIYQVKVEKIIQDQLEKIKSMIELHYPTANLDLDKTKIDIKDGKVVIQMDEMARFDQKPYMDITFARFRIARDIWENIEGIEKVEFADVFEKKTEEATADEVIQDDEAEDVEEVVEEIVKEAKEESEVAEKLDEKMEEEKE